MRAQSKVDSLARVVREILATETTDPKLEARVGDDEAWEDWARGYGAVRLLGKVSPFGAQVIEVIVKFSGTFRPHAAMEFLPGIPAHFLCNGGPDGKYSHLTDKKPGQALWKKIDRLARMLNKERSSGVRFYVKTVNKSETGFRGVQTAAWSVQTFQDTPQIAPPKTAIRFRVENTKTGRGAS